MCRLASIHYPLRCDQAETWHLDTHYHTHPNTIPGWFTRQWVFGMTYSKLKRTCNLTPAMSMSRGIPHPDYKVHDAPADDNLNTLILLPWNKHNPCSFTAATERFSFIADAVVINWQMDWKCPILDNAPIRPPKCQLKSSNKDGLNSNASPPHILRI